MKHTVFSDPDFYPLFWPDSRKIRVTQTFHFKIQTVFTFNLKQPKFSFDLLDAFNGSAQLENSIKHQKKTLIQP